nr:MAG TPA: hypothetical protein [Caudoviricetes sp.]
MFVKLNIKDLTRVVKASLFFILQITCTNKDIISV